MAKTKSKKSVSKKVVSKKKAPKKEQAKVPAISMLLYGKAGVGKSILANTFPKSLVFDFDNSHKMYKETFQDNTYISGAVQIKKGNKITNLSMIQLLQISVEQIKSGTFQYETLVIDSLTNLENDAVAFAKGLSEASWHKSLYSQNGKKMTYDNWGNISGSTISLLLELRKYDVNVVVITQVDTKQVDGTEKQYPQLIGKSQNESLHFPDFVGYMTKAEGKSGVERYLHLNSLTNDEFVAKARLVQGEVDPIKNPHYSKIAELVSANKSNLDFSN